MKKPKWRCTVAMATTMFVAIPKTAIRVRKPMIRPIPPKNSAQIARKANGAGMCMVPVKNPIVPANPEPPNQPSIFCAPSAKKTTPRTSLKITVAMLSSVETIVRIMFFLPACLALRLLCLVTRAPTTVSALSSYKAEPCCLLRLEVLLFSERGFADFGPEAGGLSTSDAAGLIVVGKISAHSDRTHHFPLFQDQDTTSDRRNATSRDGIKSRPECGSIHRPLCHRSPADPHSDRTPSFGESDIWS